VQLREDIARQKDNRPPKQRDTATATRRGNRELHHNDRIMVEVIVSYSCSGYLRNRI
jgi:hypothetical protein